jgi:hypothetical protein
MRKILFLFIILLFSGFVFAENLSEFGFEGIKLSKEDQKVCETIIVDMENQPGEGILSLKANFEGVKNDSSYVSVKINNGKEQIFWPEFFSCEGICTTRVFVPELSEGKTSLELCLKTGGKTNKAELFSNSTINFYDTPIISIKNESPEKIFLGQRAKMKITVSNKGTKDANVFVQFIAEDLRTLLEITSFDIVEGETSENVILKAGETKEFVYYIKPTLISGYNLPSAVIHFTNIFGEEQRIYSNHPSLIVQNPERVDITLISEGIEEGKFNFKIKIKNNWDSVLDGNLILEPNDIIEKSITKINIFENGEKEISFSTKELNPGNYSILARLDVNGSDFVSESSSFEIVKKDYTFELIFSIIAIIVFLAILTKIYFF